jgi:inner membrane protein
MHRQGHLGIVLLALAPVLSGLVALGRPLLALVACSVIVIEPLPDNDLWGPGLSHRGMSHSLLTAGVIGALCAGGGWVLGTYVTGPGTHWLLGTIVGGPKALTWIETHLATLDAGVLALVGFWVGSGGICLHLLGDMITVVGIRPYLPVSRRKVSLTSLRAANPYANRGLFGCGVLAIVVVGLGLTPLGERLGEVLAVVWQAFVVR